MGRKTEKGKRFEFLISRVDEAINDGYVLEAISITYSIFEERTYGFLDELGITYNHHLKLDGCLKVLKSNIESKTIGVTPAKYGKDAIIESLDKELLQSGLFDNFDKWKKERNKAIHDLAKGLIEYSDLKEVAENGKKCMRTYLALIMCVKKKL